MDLIWGAWTDVGRTRSGNEDSFLVDDSIALFVVADGMGGHRAGEVASATAVSALRASMSPTQPITAAVAAANSAVYAKAGDDPELLGMGTTVTAAVLSGTKVFIGHVGDSRCYLLRDGHLTRLTQDHSFVEQLVRDGQLTPEQAAVHPKRSILTRALGIDSTVEVDHYVATVQVGDRFLLCSDGLTSMVSESAIGVLLAADDDPQAASRRLVDAANEEGGEDNITAVVVHVVDDGTDALPLIYQPAGLDQPTAELVTVDAGPYADATTVELHAAPVDADGPQVAAAAGALAAAGLSTGQGPLPVPGDTAGAAGDDQGSDEESAGEQQGGEVGAVPGDGDAAGSAPAVADQPAAVDEPADVDEIAAGDEPVDVEEAPNLDERSAVTGGAGAVAPQETGPSDSEVVGADAVAGTRRPGADDTAVVDTRAVKAAMAGTATRGRPEADEAPAAPSAPASEPAPAPTGRQPARRSRWLVPVVIAVALIAVLLVVLLLVSDEDDDGSTTVTTLSATTSTVRSTTTTDDDTTGTADDDTTGTADDGTASTAGTSSTAPATTGSTATPVSPTSAGSGSG